ncbi:hypothetical protein F5B18DRAFT_667134 [Nemania serpens]|nr:hypothetical protein F5B18DRAFT_667134 [Nemania serpens]
MTDLILDWLHEALFRTTREGSPWVDGEDLFSVNKDESDKLDEETSGNNNPSQIQSDLSCSSGTDNCDKENMLLSQSPVGFEIWDSGSENPDEKSLDYPRGSVIEERSQFEEAAESLLQLSRDNTPAAANYFLDAGHSPADNSRLYDGPALFVQPDQGGGGHNGSSCMDSGENSFELQRMPAKKRQVEEDNDTPPHKRVKISGDLIFTISAIRIRRVESGEVEALSYDSGSGVWFDLDGVEYDFDEGRFAGARVAFVVRKALYNRSILGKGVFTARSAAADTQDLDAGSTAVATMAESNNFKVIIAGGGVVGLMLANALEGAGIDFILLEKKQIAPDLGASISLLCHNSRVCEQLGVLDLFNAATVPLLNRHHFSQDGYAEI